MITFDNIFANVLFEFKTLPADVRAAYVVVSIVVGVGCLALFAIMLHVYCPAAAAKICNFLWMLACLTLLRTVCGVSLVVVAVGVLALLTIAPCVVWGLTNNSRLLEYNIALNDKILHIISDKLGVKPYQNPDAAFVKGVTENISELFKR